MERASRAEGRDSGKHPILSPLGVTRILELILDQVHCGLSHLISTSIKRADYCTKGSYQQEFQWESMGMGAEEARTFIFAMGKLLLTPENEHLDTP